MVSNSSICIIGSLNIDFVTYTPRCPGPGETLTASSLAVNAGGKGANQAVGCGRASFTSKDTQDVSVYMIGAVGADDPYYSKLLRPQLQQSGVDTKLVEERSDSQTGTATIIVENSTGGENRILVVPGANHSGMNDSNKILNTLQKQPALPNVVVMQGEIPRDTVLDLLKYFNNASCPVNVIFNPAPMFPEGITLEALNGTAVLVMNETEATQMIASISGTSASSLPDLELDPEAAALRLHEIAHINIVLITLGAKGVYFSTESGQRGFVSGVRVSNVVDTTAAGDTFVGYFAASLARHISSGGSLENFDDNAEAAVKLANTAASVCVQREGAMQSIPYGYEN